jgi:predicted alpha/beta-hydrolase family hydrolase
MEDWAARLAKLGKVVRFDYPYRLAGRRAPDRLPVLIEAHRAALLKARAHHAGPVVLVGKSMGSRVGCHLSLQEPVDALVCLGYPLRSPTGQLRDQVLRELTTPILFVQGSRDSLCPLATLQEIGPSLKAPHALHVVEGGDHSLQVGVRVLQAAGDSQADVDARVFSAIRTFIGQHMG